VTCPTQDRSGRASAGTWFDLVSRQPDGEQLKGRGRDTSRLEVERGPDRKAQLPEPARRSFPIDPARQTASSDHRQAGLGDPLGLGMNHPWSQRFTWLNLTAPCRKVPSGPVPANLSPAPLTCTSPHRLAPIRPSQRAPPGDQTSGQRCQVPGEANLSSISRNTTIGVACQGVVEACAAELGSMGSRRRASAPRGADGLPLRSRPPPATRSNATLYPRALAPAPHEGRPLTRLVIV
jgi:hypothetical protein